MSAPTTYQMERELAELRHDLAQARAERGAAQRQAAASYARAEELREAAGALIDGLIKHLDAHDVAACEDWASPDTDCQGIATQYLVSGSGDGDDLCDVCAAAREERGWVLKAERPHAAPLRTLRKLLGGAS